VRALFSPRVGVLAEYLCLTLCGSAAMVIFSYLCLASAYGPLVDQALLRADLALGFDWLTLHDRVMAHPRLALAAYERLFSLDETDPEPLQAERLLRARAMLHRRLFDRVIHGAREAFQFLDARCDRVVENVLNRIRG